MSVWKSTFIRPIGIALCISVVIISIAVVRTPHEPNNRSAAHVVTVDPTGHLVLDGNRYRFVGVNVYSLASGARGVNGFVCGRDLTDEQVRSILDEIEEMGCNAVRIDAYQAFTDGGRDFARIDLILREAERRGIRVIMTLENHWHDCTQGGIKDASWYRNGYLWPYGSYRLSYLQHVTSIVTRYRDDPAVLMWQLMNEGEISPTDSVDEPEAFYAFVRAVTLHIRRIDGNHVISIGTSGVGSPGSGGAFYGPLHGIENVDIVEAHDYHHERIALPQDIAVAITVARWLGKPFFVGEVGIRVPPFTSTERAALLRRKLEALWHADVDGILVWSFQAGDGRGNDFDRNDPLAGEIRDFTRRTIKAGTP